MAYIGPLPAETFTSFATQEFSTSATTSYTLDHAVTNENEIALFINNVRQQPGSGKAYTATGTALTLSAATASTDTMYAVFLGRALQTVNPADASVGTSQLAATSVTAAKLNNDIISGLTALSEAPASTDELLVSDGGTIKRVDFSLLASTPHKTLLSTTTLSSTSEVVFNNSLITSTYRDYQITFSNLQTSADGVELYVFFSSDNGSSYPTGNCHRNQFGLIASSDTVQVGTDTGRNDIKLSGIADLGTASGETCSGEMRFYDLLGTDNHKTAIGTTAGDNSSGTGFISVTGGTYRSETAVNALKVAPSSGNMASGIIKFYGIT